MPTLEYFPEAYEALAKSDLGRAFWLSQAAFAIKYEMIHGGKDLPEAAKAQRNAILDIAYKLLESACHREMSQAFSRWKAYEVTTRG